MPIINYVISNYVGKRRYAPNPDPLFYIKRQCDFFKENKIPLVELITFCLNRSNDTNIDNLFIDYVGAQKLLTPHEILLRENIGFSYGAWQDAVAKNIDYDFHFFIEDDYIPVDMNVLNRFLILDEKTIYVCQLYKNNHCAISNGLFNTSILKHELNRSRINKNAVLNIGIENTDSYVLGCANQVVFLKNFSNIGYRIKSLDKVKHEFSHLGTIINYGSMKGEVIIKPIY